MPKASGASLVLASGSQTRHRLLKAAGVSFEVVTPQVDEAVVREAVKTGAGGVEPADVAEILARAKAEEVSARHPDAVVIGADQILSCDDEIFSKAETIDDARATLLKLRGRTHELHSAVAIAEDGETTWTMVDTAHLTMRAFTPACLGQYMVQAGAGVLDSVGCYKLEEAGIQLFERIEGDYFTILGLPMLPLLAELRGRKLVMV